MKMLKKILYKRVKKELMRIYRHNKMMKTLKMEKMARKIKLIINLKILMVERTQKNLIELID